MLKMPAQIRSVREWLSKYWKNPTRRQLKVSAGALGAVGLSLVLLAVASSPEQQPQRAALSGKALFETVLAQHPSVRNDSRVRRSKDRGSSTNRVVLPAAVWELLDIDQRNSLGTWLNSIGGRWEIRTGRLSADRNRVGRSEAVITSRQWNQQVK